MIKITVFKRYKHTENGSIGSFKTLLDMGNWLRECVNGGKLGQNFVRGGLNPNKRRDEYLKESNLIILDADHGTKVSDNAPSPLKVHNALKKLGYNHVIYTTHSHSAKKNKYRVVIETEEVFNQEHLAPNIAIILKELSGRGIVIGNCPEMSTWSQIWFTATRDDKDDGMFKSYAHYSGNKYKIRYEEIEETEETEEANDSQSSLDELYENIRTGDELHTSLRNISYQNAKDGMSESNNLRTMQSLMKSSEVAGSERWLLRYESLERLIHGAYELKDEVDYKHVKIDKLAKNKAHSGNMPIPPGRMGEFTRTAYNNMIYQYQDIAIFNVVGALAGVAGRKFNYNFATRPIGLNVYLAIIGDTGTGKSSVSAFHNEMLNKGFREGLTYKSAFGPTKFTGDKAVHNTLSVSRCFISIVPELGLILQTKSGNQEGLRAYYLQAYGESNATGYMGGSMYSDVSASLMGLHSPCLSIIGETTPSSYSKAISESDGIKSGLMPRFSTTIMGKQPFMRRVVKQQYSDDVCMRIEELFGMCSSIQTVDIPDVINITGYEDEFLDYSNALIDIKNKENNEYRRDMITRMAVKAVKFAGLCAVFNSNGIDVVMDEDSFNWGIAMVEHELARSKEVVDTVSGDFGSYEIVIEIFRQTVEDLLLGNVSNGYLLPLEETNKGLVQISMIKRIMKFNKDVKKYLKSSIQKSIVSIVNDIIRELKSEGELLTSGRSRGVTKYVRITAEFNLNR